MNLTQRLDGKLETSFSNAIVGHICGQKENTQYFRDLATALFLRNSSLASEPKNQFLSAKNVRTHGTNDPA